MYNILNNKNKLIFEKKCKRILNRNYWWRIKWDNIIIIHMLWKLFPNL